MPSFTQQGLLPYVATALFLGMAAVTLAGAVVAVASHRLVRSVAGLALCFIGLAGLYYFLNNPFLALMQILIYVGAVCVTIMFALMMADPNDTPLAPRSLVRVALAALVAGAFGAGLLVLIGAARWMPAAARPTTGTLQDIGRALLTTYGFAFELISVVLLLGILGALIVARAGRRTQL